MAELRRVVRPEGMLIAATNSKHELGMLFKTRSSRLAVALRALGYPLGYLV